MDWVSLIIAVIGFVGNFASIYILSLPSIGRWQRNNDDDGGDYDLVVPAVSQTF